MQSQCRATTLSLAHPLPLFTRFSLVPNMEDGFPEAFLRGLRSTFLSDAEYANLKEGGQRSGGDKGKEDFEDLRLTLQETDYGNLLQNEVRVCSRCRGGPAVDPGRLTPLPPHTRAQPALDPKIIAQRMTGKWVAEFKYLRMTASGPLATFLDFVSYEYVIDNILDLIKAATSSQSVDIEAVVEGCHPLGMLEPSTMKSILAYDNLGEEFHALYRTILVDTPVGKYFTSFIQEQVDEKAAMDPDSVRGVFAEIPMTLIENSVKKLYLEDFNRFCLDTVSVPPPPHPRPRPQALILPCLSCRLAARRDPS
jgi:V-type H+-transporting ATPase subunit d